MDATGSTALHHACATDAEGLTEIVDMLAGACAGDAACINARDDAGRTPLATCINQLGLVYILSRPLQNPYVLAVQNLIEVYGADVNTPDFLGHTPLMMAARVGEQVGATMKVLKRVLWPWSLSMLGVLSQG